MPDKIPEVIFLLVQALDINGNKTTGLEIKQACLKGQY